jgi:hypothetical protein
VSWVQPNDYISSIISIIILLLSDYIIIFLLLLWAFGFLFDISETFPCLVCLLLAKTVLLLDALQQLMLFVET